MNIDDFWAIIEKGTKSDSPEDVLATELTDLSINELISFQEHFDVLVDKAYRWDIWGAAYIINFGCSDDGFTDFRYGLISKGKNIYEKTLENPDSLAELGSDLELDNELFGYMALEVYQALTSEEMPQKDSICPDEPLGEAWDFDDETQNKQHLPHLTSVFN